METQAYFEDIQHYILKELHKARTSILVADYRGKQSAASGKEDSR